MYSLKLEETDVWTYLQSCNKPIVMYGTGNGADKILDVFDKYSIKVSDIFVSDEFFRPKEFHGYKLLRYSDIVLKYDDCVIILAFAVFRDDMLSFVKDLSDRFEVRAPEVPVFGTDYFSIKTIEDHHLEIEKIKDLLADDISVQTFESILNYRITGKISYLNKASTNRDHVFQDIICLDSDESYLDLGAYRGDTIEEFLKLTNEKFFDITALEPDTKNYNKMCEYVDSLSIDKTHIHLINKASWSSEYVMSFVGGGGRNSALGTGAETVHATDIDSLLWKLENVKPFTYVKMDVEGAEHETIEGMRRLLINSKPKLAVSAYHRTCDLFSLPLLINSINPSYKIYLRHHPYIPDWETNYYCI